MRDRRARMWAWVVVGLVAMVPGSRADAADWPPADGARVLFLGDSITQDGRYVRYIDALLSTRLPDRTVEVINLGLSGETVSGLSEPQHPPRPHLQTRLARALELAKPDLAFICYGMNDGIYHPPSPGRIDAYRKGMEEAVAAVRGSGAAVIVGTPPPFDPVPIREKTAPLGDPPFGYGRFYAGYDGVLGIYAGFLLDHADRTARTPAERWTVADIHGASVDALMALRVAEPGLALTKDGVHPGGDGHWLIARPYLEAWGVPADVDAAVLASTVDGVASVRGRVTPDPDPRPADGSIGFTWSTRVPLPRDPTWSPRLVALERLDERFNRHRLTVAGLDRGRYALYEGDDKVGEATRVELAEGLDLLRFPALSTNRRAAEIGALIVRKHEILDPAWREAVGPARSGRPKARPLADYRRDAEPIVAQIRDLAQPAPIHLRLVPLGD